jgi:hypothetical protein
VFPAPANQVVMATIVMGMMTARITEANREHVEATRIYLTYHNVNQAFKKLIFDTFEDQFLNALSKEVTGYANCTSLQFMCHIFTHYAMITPTELMQNYERLNTLCYPNQPIETLFQKIQDVQAFEVAGGQRDDDAIISNVAFTLVFKTGLFPDACRT